MTALFVWALFASVVAGVQTLRVGDLKGRLRMPELPPVAAARKKRNRKGPRR